MLKTIEHISFYRMRKSFLAVIALTLLASGCTGEDSQDVTSTYDAEVLKIIFLKYRGQKSKTQSSLYQPPASDGGRTKHRSTRP
ncbi:MAG: hypothetical protein BRC30_00225 [Nanohaloarchaea archaeon SW_7_46_7]|nr:MAG: hypothetical protein BRC30_00225 [Nanohaloarchaea archaeon SW_7_46_7]